MYTDHQQTQVVKEEVRRKKNAEGLFTGIIKIGAW